MLSWFCSTRASSASRLEACWWQLGLALTQAATQGSRGLDLPSPSTAYKMTRTLVANPFSYEGLIVNKVFADGKTYSGTYPASMIYIYILYVLFCQISWSLNDCTSHNWRGNYRLLWPQAVVEGKVEDNDEEDWAVPEMINKMHNSFCDLKQYIIR